MSTINKQLMGFMFSGSALTLASAGFKNSLNSITGFNSAGTAYTSFRPTSNFNSLTQLVQDGVYIVDAKTTGFDIPGAVLIASGSGAVSPTITGFLPISGARGSMVVLTGTGFTGATQVSINSGAVASFVVDSATKISAVLSNSQATGKVRVTTPAGTAVSSSDFTVAASSTPTGLDVAFFTTPDQSNGSGLSNRADTPASYYNTNPRAKGFDYTTNTLSTFSLGSLNSNGSVINANDHAITKELVPTYPNGIGPATGFVKRWLDNNAGNSRELAVYVKDLTPPVNTNSSTTTDWLSNGLLAGWKLEVKAFIGQLQAAGYTEINPYFFAGLGEGNGAGGPSTVAIYYRDMTVLLNIMSDYVRSFASPTFVINDIRVGIVKKQQAQYQNSIVPLQQQLAGAYSRALLIDLPNVDPVTSFQSDGLHYITPEILRLGAYEADKVDGGWAGATPVTPALVPQNIVVGTKDVDVVVTGTAYTTSSQNADWSHAVNVSGVLAAGAVGGVQMQLDAAGGQGFVFLQKTAGRHTINDADYGGLYQGIVNGEATFAWIGGGGGGVIPFKAAIGSGLRIWRREDMVVREEYSKTNGAVSDWVEVKNYGFYDGPLWGNFDVKGTPDGGVYKPQSYNIS